MSSRRLACALLAALALATTPARASAQQVDSVALRIRASLARLGRPPAPDTGALATDSIADREIRGGGGARPGAQRAQPTSGDSIIALLMGLPGYDATQYRGTAADFDAESQVLILQGDSASRAVVTLQGAELTADSLIHYDEASGRIRAEGRPVFTGPEGDPVQSQRVVYDIAAERGTAYGARTKYTEGATWFVTGDLPSVTPGVVYGAHADFTSCELTEPHYHFSADNVKIIAGRVLVARPVKLYFADVPVAWLPFMAQSLGSGRASGLLTPRFSINDIVRTSRGYDRRVSNVGFYWAMSDYLDATVAMDWFSGNFTSLTGSMRYSWAKQFLNGTLDARQYWKNEGGTQTTVSGGSDWQIDERTRLNGNIRWMSEGGEDFTRRYSYDPQELTNSIESAGGIQRRFDFASASISATRQQWVSTGKIDMTLPDASFTLTPVTLLRAPTLRARWFNNLTWSAGINGRRQITEEGKELIGSVTTLSPDRRDLSGGAHSRFNLGNLSWDQRVSVRQPTQFDVPAPGATAGLVGFSPSGRALVTSTAAAEAVELIDKTETSVDWSSSLGYQQTLIGSTTITPQLSLSGQRRRSNTDSIAPDQFVSSPRRLAFGATLKSDLFGFYPGFGPFEAVRHKASPSFDFSYAPEVSSTPRQQAVYGRLELQPTQLLRVTFNQTFEAKRRAVPGDTAAPTPSAAARLAPGDRALDLPEDTTGGLSTAGGLGAGMRRAPRADIATLLALTTDVVQYDFVEADEQGDFLWGFQTTSIGNQIRSDYLQGLSISMRHDLFADTTIGERRERKLDLHLSDLNLGFALSNRSAIFRGFGLWGSEPDSVQSPIVTTEAEAGVRTPENPFVQTTSATDEASIVPRSNTRPGDPRDPRAGREDAEVGSWNASFTYSLVRNRSVTSASEVLGISATMKPTALWDLNWRTSYDIESKRFSDHVIGLSRDIHDWEARFDFIKTATGNWSFRFDVALKANRDFKFDYAQRNQDLSQSR